MSAAPGRMMAAWVWISVVTLAWLITATGTHRDSEGSPTVLEALLSDSELPVGTRNEGGFFPVPVWKFLKEHGGGDEDFGRPQFRCSNSSLSVRFSLIRHSDLRLLDGKKLLSLPDGCNGSVRIHRPWLLLNLSYSGCNVALQKSNGTGLHQLTVRYFDQLLQTNVTGVATCENPAALQQLVSPLVTCETTAVLVKLPLGTRLRRVRALGKDNVVGRALTETTPDSLFVRISTPENRDSVLEVVYSDSAGEMWTMLAACVNAVTQSGLTRHQRAAEPYMPAWAYSDVDLESTEDLYTTTTEEPCETTTTEEPCETTTEEPCETTTTEEPCETTTTEEPCETTTTEEPCETTTTEEPCETTTTEEPCETTTTEEPCETTTTEEPCETTTTEEPCETTTTEEPCETTTTEEPCETTTTEEPCETTTTEEPCETTTTEEPCETTTTEEPCETDTTTEEPCESTTTEEPCESTTTEEPCESTTTEEPCETDTTTEEPCETDTTTTFTSTGPPSTTLPPTATQPGPP